MVRVWCVYPLLDFHHVLLWHWNVVVHFILFYFFIASFQAGLLSNRDIVSHWVLLWTKVQEKAWWTVKTWFLHHSLWWREQIWWFQWSLHYSLIVSSYFCLFETTRWTHYLLSVNDPKRKENSTQLLIWTSFPGEPQWGSVQWSWTWRHVTTDLRGK